MRLTDRSVHFENLAFFRSSILHNMDFRQKMVVASSKTHMHNDGEDDDDEDLEALRMAALQSLRPKDNLRMNPQIRLQTRINTPQIAQPRMLYKGQRPQKRSFYQTRPLRQNGGICFQSHLNPNLIAIVPVEDEIVIQQSEPSRKLSDTASPSHNQAADESKFCRYRDDPSGSEEEDDGDRRGNISDKPETETAAEERACHETGVELSDSENVSTHDESPQRSEEDEKEEDDDDVLLMADLEEEDSLERLMDEMEREMSVDKPSDVTEKRHSRKENRSAKREETNKKQKDRTKLEPRRTNRSRSPTVPSPLVPSVLKNEPRPLSPKNSNRPVHRRRSLSPKPRSRKKSPRRSPRRSPPRQPKKSQRDGGGREPLRFRSPRKSPPRFSPRPRSPRLSPRRLSPQRLSPRLSPYLRSPCRLPRSRSPRISPRPRSPRLPRSRSPRSSPRRSPARLSPRKLSPRSIRSPKLSPRLRSPRLSPRRSSPRTRSPRISPRRMSPRTRSPRMSPRTSPRRLSPRARSPRLTPPRRISPRTRSPVLSPHRSPWSSPRNSPRLSPRRRRSPKELSRKIRPRSITPCRHQSPLVKRGSSPNSRAKHSPDEPVKSKPKQKEEAYEKATPGDTGKGGDAVNNDPVLEARRRKFESTKPIDLVSANKKIKLSRKDNRNKKSDLLDEAEVDATNLRNAYKVNAEVEYETMETDSYLGEDFEFEDLEEPIEESPAATIASAVNVCSEIEPAKLEREKPVKKKKKKDKELYQVHKSKGELPLSERIGKEKKCKKRKEVVTDGPTEKTETIFEDLTVDEEEGDLRTELSRRRAERLNRTGPIHQQSVRLVQSAFKGVVSEVVKSNAKSIRKQLVKGDEKQNHKEVRRVTVLHRPVSDLHESEDETIVDSKVPVRFRLGVNKASQDTRDSKVSRKNSKRQSRKSLSSTPRRPLTPQQMFVPRVSDLPSSLSDRCTRGAQNGIAISQELTNYFYCKHGVRPYHMRSQIRSHKNGTQVAYNKAYPYSRQQVVRQFNREMAKPYRKAIL